MLGPISPTDIYFDLVFDESKLIDRTEPLNDLPDFNREEFLEEVVDAFNYFLSMLVLVGVSEDEFFQAYNLKDKKIRNRLITGY